MSYYDKKYIKGDHKKDCHKEDDYKHYCKKDPCKDDHHECKDDYCEKEENGIYTELQVNEAVLLPSVGNIPDTPQVTTSPPLTLIARKTICVDDSSDRVLVNATVEWAPQGTATGLVGFATGLLSGIPASFKVWRKNRNTANSVPELVFESTDSSPVALLPVAGSATFARVTTSFHFVDQDPLVGENEYILTMEPAITSIIGILVAIITALVGFLPPGISFTNAVTTHVFTLAEIEENK
ncbi:hypothetical protein [Priestia megaterium]|uniref:hypothetical protein n=1 Tax=Priestia megaterium TaxID=1404 RepID=UPI000BA678C5|nr:hypothetical protein [Priestia megaterium]PAK49510.1 hypothetical protein CHH47_12995 [Priestia megaterium]